MAQQQQGSAIGVDLLLFCRQFRHMPKFRQTFLLVSMTIPELECGILIALVWSSTAIPEFVEDRKHSVIRKTIVRLSCEAAPGMNP
jgi:hypothetical protein